MATEIQTVGGFDYSRLSKDDADHARAAAHRIRRQEQKATEAVFEIGRDLIAIKQMLDHGQFIAWVEAECSSAVRTVQNYMKAAQAFEGKYAMVAHLAPATVYALAAAPSDARNEIVGRLEAGERPTEGQIKDRIYEARQLAKQARLVGKLTAAQRKARQRRAAAVRLERERHQRQWEERLAARGLATERAAALIVRSMGSDAEALSELLEAAGTYEELVQAIRTAT